MKHWKHICIFISSTFKDMDVERDALRSIVESKINKFLEKYMLSIEFIDLRHSVKTDKKASEEERERQICAVCLDEIKRCSPYFIGLLGHRYGWIPPRGIIGNNKTENNVFPIESERLSVTAHEFIHGLFAKGNETKGLIFLRKESSYKNLPKEAMNDFIDDGENRVLVGKVRDFITTNSGINSLDYEIDLSAVNTSTISQWVEMTYNAVLELIKTEYQTRETEDELSEFLSAQERYVQQKTKDFKGRQKELDESRQKLEDRRECIIAEKESGMGAHSLHCKLYDEYRKDESNVCLFYSPEASNEYKDFEQVLYFWTLWLDREYMHEGVCFADWKNNKNEIHNKLEAFINTLNERGKQIYAFICGTQFLNKYLSPNMPIKACNLCIYTQEIQFLRPLMYIVEPYRKETIATIIEPLRPQVRKTLLEHPRSSHAEWLNLAITLLDRMNKMDFIVIRHNTDSDNEQNIVNHQLQMIEQFPDDVNEMRQKWVLKVRESIGKDIVDKIIFALTLNDNGLSASECCEFVECQQIDFSIACSILGPQIVCEQENGLWSLADWDIWRLMSERISTDNKMIVIKNAAHYIQKYPTVRQANEMALRVYMLSNDIAAFAKLMGNDDINTSNISENYANDFVWMATTMPDVFKNFIHHLTESGITISYKFIFNLIICIKKIHFNDNQELYGFCLHQLKHWLRNYWLQGRSDSATYSLMGDLLACEADMLSEQHLYKEFFDTIQYGLLHSEELMKDEPLWTKAYLFFVYRKLFTLQPDLRFDFLKETFIQKERLGMIKLPEKDDSTLYSILAMEAAKHYAAAEDAISSDFMKKAVNAALDMLDKLQTNKVESRLRPIDAMRNLLYDMYIAFYMYENTAEGIIDENWLQQKGWEVVERCKVISAKFKDDNAYFYYYDLIGKLIRISEISREERIYKLYDYVAEACGGAPITTYLIAARNMSMTTPGFAAFVSLQSAILLQLAMIDDHECPNTEHIRELSFSNDMLDIVKKEETLEFNKELRLILPSIGAKQMNENGLMPDLLKSSMCLIYESMINVELEKDAPDEKLITKLANSWNAESHEAYADFEVPCTIYITNTPLLDSILEKYEDCYDMYDDFSDCFGIRGDIYSSPDGMWSNGDPELYDQLEIINTPYTYTWSRTKLEECIINSDYNAIIQKFEEVERLSMYEAFYLSLAFMRTGRFEEAYNVLSVLMSSDLSADVISDGEIFSVMTNFLIAALLSNHIEEFEDFYSSMTPENCEDDDIIEIHQAYLQAKENGDWEINLPMPYGYMI